jgi:hypothetical protein
MLLPGEQPRSFTNRHIARNSSCGHLAGLLYPIEFLLFACLSRHHSGICSSPLLSLFMLIKRARNTRGKEAVFLECVSQIVRLIKAKQSKTQKGGLFLIPSQQSVALPAFHAELEAAAAAAMKTKNKGKYRGVNIRSEIQTRLVILLTLCMPFINILRNDRQHVVTDKSIGPSGH